MLSLIAAVAANGAIGKGGKLPWHLPGDLAHFKRLTLGKTVIMGRKTFESLPGLLPGRRHVVITSGAAYGEARPGIEAAASLEEAIAKAPPGGEAFIIGGASVYRDALPLCRRLYITEICADYDGDTFFPSFDKSLYEAVSRSEMLRENGAEYRFVCYERFSL